jgi:hypothetical protein
MANPVIVPVAAGVWTKVATGVTDGTINILDHTFNYLYTHRDTGDPAPTDRTEGALFEGKSMLIDSSVAIDVYVWPEDPNGGSVRADL